MKLEYNYRVGPQGIEFSLIDGLDDEIDVEGTVEQQLTIRRYVMQAWQDAINRSSTGPDEIRGLLETAEGQRLLQERARAYLAEILADFPPELDRRKMPDRRDLQSRPRENPSDRRYPGKRPN